MNDNDSEPRVKRKLVRRLANQTLSSFQRGIRDAVEAAARRERLIHAVDGGRLVPCCGPEIKRVVADHRQVDWRGLAKREGSEQVTRHWRPLA